METTRAAEPSTRPRESAGREVSCRALTIFFERLDDERLPPRLLIEGTGYPEEHLRNVAERMNWAAFMVLCRNAGRLWGNEGLDAMGERILAARWARPFLAVGRVLYTPADLYRFLARPKLGGRDMLMSCVTWRLEQVGPRRLLLEMVLDAGYEACPELLRVSESMLKRLPTALGLPQAELRREATDTGARYDIRLPHGGGTLARLGRVATWPLRAHSVARELEEAWEELHRRTESLQEEIRRRRRAETILRERERRFELLLERSADFVILFSPRGEVVYVSPSGRGITSYSEAELVGRRHPELIHPDDADRFFRDFDSVVTTPWAEAVTTYRFRRRDGTWIWLEQTTRNLLEDPSVAAVVSNVRDVTERRALEMQLDHAQRMDSVGRLAGGIAHDFNNLLTSIQGFAEILSASLPEEDARRSHLDGVLHSAGRAAELTSQLLAFARKRSVAPRVVEPGALVGRLRTLLGRLLTEDVDLQVHAPRDVGSVEVDPGQLEQVLLNLAVNARDAMPSGGTLTIRCEDARLTRPLAHRHGRIPPGDYVRLRVSDTGAGMDEAVLEQLFEPFFTTKAPGEGTGLGLSTSWGIVRQAGGHLVVDSAPGQGSRFDVYLPRVERRAEETATQPEVTDVPGGDETILLVEDEPMVRAFVDHVLREKGYRVISAVHARDALQRLEEAADGAIDLLVTDVRMPGDTGPALARHLRSTRPELPVLLISGYAEGEELRAAMEADRTLLLQKPFSARRLAAEVRRLVDGAAGETQ
ncbi:MAG: hybrid sensor histidine kinase/response regulator [Myxococcota bacterium]